MKKKLYPWGQIIVENPESVSQKENSEFKRIEIYNGGRVRQTESIELMDRCGLLNDCVLFLGEEVHRASRR